MNSLNTEQTTTYDVMAWDIHKTFSEHFECNENEYIRYRNRMVWYEVNEYCKLAKIVMKGKFSQQWSTIPLIPTTRTVVVIRCIHQSTELY